MNALLKLEKVAIKMINKDNSFSYFSLFLNTTSEMTMRDTNSLQYVGLVTQTCVWV